MCQCTTNSACVSVLLYFLKQRYRNTLCECFSVVALSTDSTVMSIVSWDMSEISWTKCFRCHFNVPLIFSAFRLFCDSSVSDFSFLSVCSLTLRLFQMQAVTSQQRLYSYVWFGGYSLLGSDEVWRNLKRFSDLFSTLQDPQRRTVKRLNKF